MLANIQMQRRLCNLGVAVSRALFTDSSDFGIVSHNPVACLFGQGTTNITDGLIDVLPVHVGIPEHHSHPAELLALRVVQLGHLPGGLRVDQALGSTRVEAKHPFANRLKADATDPRRVTARSTVIDLRQSQ